MRNRIEVMHGVNLDALGRRPAAHYGDITFERLEHRIGEFVEHLHRLEGMADAIVLNPGAWTHYSWAIRDALEIAALPAVEVHLSDVEHREEFRRTSVVRDLCVATVAGKGPDGYRDALDRLKAELSA